MGKIRSLAGVMMAAAALCMACGGQADAQKKRVRELEEELTRLQNVHDRLDERVTSLELSRSVPQENTSKAPESAESDDSEKSPTATLERPPLKVFRLAPSGSGATHAAEVEEQPAGDDDQGEPRPVIRGRGQHVEKAPGSTGTSGSKARASKLSQNDSVPPAGSAKANR